MKLRHVFGPYSQIAVLYSVFAILGCSSPDFASIESTLTANTGLGEVQPPEPTPAARRQIGHRSFTQVEGANQVDILIVNDNSYSMYADQQKMAQRFGSFISSIADLDYHIGMTTTDAKASGGSQQGELLKWFGIDSIVLTPSTADASDAFLKTIARKETLDCIGALGIGCPSSDERPIQNVIEALDGRETFNTGFFRDTADLIVLILSDEDEASDGGPTATRGSTLIEHVQSIYGSSKNLQVHGIVVRPGDLSCLTTQRTQAGNDLGSAYGNFVAELAHLTGGSLGDICADDYSPQLARISQEARKLITSIKLDQVPLAGTVSVTLDPQDAISFTVEDRQLIFARPPAPGTKVEISYEY